MKTTWRKLILTEMSVQKESFNDVIGCTLSYEELDVEFHAGYGSVKGKEFTLWTTNRVYFPVCYDGAQWVGSVSNRPDGKPTKHIGDN